MNRKLLVLVVPFALTACWPFAAKTPEVEPVPDVTNIDAPIGKDVVMVAMPSGKKLEDPEHGTEAFLAVGAMEGINDTPGNGVVTIHVFSDKTTIVGMQLNIQVPEDGEFYEAWLAGNDEKPTVSLGHLTNPFGDVRHQLRFEKKEDLRRFTKAVVTLEMDDGNPQPSDSSVAKGTLKAQKRG
jgi:Anti-sigma-K factor rskA